ncbi:ubiquitin-conjugating enzyme E2 T [Entomortierella parvispora]|uniref:E2 ubiquitin-conjugating enzyme n=1 Tax=Entomortierella parvispora TaxID=205924 RepID=A0A9P3H1P8_9FUNG|nr:ubiquitin-conjugating enzyme E2 T [Entomortierella parvispora]
MAGRLNMTAGRLNKELKDLECKPPEGVICYPVNDSMVHLHAELEGPEDTPYVGGVFQIEINIPERYPLEPPRCQFLTKVYHPNIDDEGRICLDILKTGSKGTWRPSLNIQTVLTSLRVLLAYPNPDDPLIVDIANEFKDNQEGFTLKAKDYTRRYAIRRIESSNSTFEIKDAISSEEKESGRTKTLAGPQSSLSSSPSSLSSSAPPASTPISQTLPISTSMPEPLSNLFGLGLGPSISTPGRSLPGKRPALKKPNLSMRKPTVLSPATPLSEPAASTEAMDIDGCTTLTPAESCQHDQQDEALQRPAPLPYVEAKEAVIAVVAEDIPKQTNLLPASSQNRPLSKKRSASTPSTTLSLTKSSKKSKKVPEKATGFGKGKEEMARSQQSTSVSMIVNLEGSDTTPGSAEDRSGVNRDVSVVDDSPPSNSTQSAAAPEVEIQSRFFVNIAEIIAEPTMAHELDQAPTSLLVVVPEPELESIPMAVPDAMSDPTVNLSSNQKLESEPEPSYLPFIEHSPQPKSETPYQAIQEQNLAPKPKAEPDPVHGDAHCGTELIEPAAEVITRLDKGKGRAIEPQEPVRKDFAQLPTVDSGMVRKTYVVPLSERQTNVPSSHAAPSTPLTVARKRDLLKKRQPPSVERKVE